jgi:UDP-glucose 4-epimerase
MKQQENKNILVTGGLGYIGSNTVVKLFESGYNPIIIDDLSNSDFSRLNELETITNSEIHYYDGDIRAPKSFNNLSYIMKKYDIDSVMHFAAFKSVNESVKNPLKYYNNNIYGTINLLEMMKKYNVKNLIFSSSCTVYGQPDKYPVCENSQIKPSESPYGETKQMCESILKNISEKEDINVVSLRYFNPIGCHESGLLSDKPKGVPENLMPYIIGVLKKEYEYLRIFGNDYNTKDGTAIRDYIDINDLAESHVKALDIVNKKDYQTINVGSGGGYSVMEIVECFKSLGYEIPFKVFPRRKGDIEIIYGDISKAKEIMKWTPKRTVLDSVNSILKSIS